MDKQFAVRDPHVVEIMETSVHAVNPETTVKDAASLMSKEGHGCVIVVSGNLAMGIVTERDIVRKVTAEGFDPIKIRVQDIMSSPLITISSSSTVRDAAEKMSMYEIRRIVVTEDLGKMLGLLTAGDLARWLAKLENYDDPTLNAIARLKRDRDSPYG